MNLIKSIVAGFAGALALNLLHETVRKFDPSAPRIDLLGEEAFERSAESLNLNAPKGDDLYLATLAGDILSNAAYFSMVGIGSKKHSFLRAAGIGLTAGIGAVKLPEPLGLDEAPTAGSDKRKIMTIGYYVFGALTTAAALKYLSKK